MDEALFQAVNRGLAAPWLDVAMAAFSWLYGPGLWLLLAGLAALLLLRRRRLDALRLAGALLAATTVSTLLKHAIDRPRPAAVLEGVRVVGDRLSAHSMPSGHTTAAFVLGVWLLLLDRRAGAVALGAAALAGLSRVYVGAHWPTDVLAGAALGATAALLARPRPGPRPAVSAPPAAPPA